MSRVTLILSLLLIVQLGFATMLKISEAKFQVVTPDTNLITYDFNTLNKIEIEQNEKFNGKNRKVVLEKPKDRWIISSYYNFPASRTDVGQLIEKLKSAKRGLPVATTSSAMDVLKVSPQDFVKTITLSSEKEKPLVVYVGTAQNFHTVHMRINESPEIYAVEFDQYNVYARPEAWIDKNFAAPPLTGVASVDMGKYVVRQKKGDEWTLLVGDRTYAISKRIVEHELLDKLDTICVIDVLGAERKPEFNADAPFLSFKVSLNDGKTVSYAVSKAKTDNRYILKLSNFDLYLQLDRNLFVTSVADITADSLLKTQAQYEKAKAEAAKKAAAKSGGRNGNASGAENNASAGKDATAAGKDATGAGKDSTGAGKDSTGAGKDATGAGKDSTGAGKDAIGAGKEATGAGKDATGAGKDAIGTDKDATGATNGGAAKDTAGTGKNSSAMPR